MRSMLSRRIDSLWSTPIARSEERTKFSRTRNDSNPITKNKSRPARTLVTTENRTIKRQFHKAASNTLFHQFVFTVGFCLDIWHLLQRPDPTVDSGNAFVHTLVVPARVNRKIPYC